jgi:CheY-like chemotaxis protein
MPSLLIVDDDPGFRRIARALLESQGFNIVGEAEDGQAALAAVAELGPDVVLLDVQLPDLDGLEVASRLTADGGGPAVVLTSTRDESDFGPHLLDSCGVRGFVSKDELSGSRIAELCR